jgi:hypothetical protein
LARGYVPSRGASEIKEDEPMMKRLSGGGFAAGVLLVSGAALSSDQTVAVVRVLDFNIFTQQLRAQPQEGPAVVFVHTPTTLHLASFIGEGQHPPDPCFNIATTWTGLVNDGKEDGRPNVLAFEFLLGLMAPFQCNATVTATVPSADAPAQILSIAPVIK